MFDAIVYFFKGVADMSWRSKILNEITFEYTRSGGAGGQHVNKTESAVILRFSVNDSQVLSEAQKQRIYTQLAHRLNNADELLVREERQRDRDQNKSKAIEKFLNLLEQAFYVAPERKKTKPTRASKVRRLESKKKLSFKKQSRQLKKNFDD